MVYLFFFFCQRPDPNLLLTLNHATCDVYLPKTVTDIVFFIVCKICFLLVLALDPKGIINILKKGIMSAMEFTDVAAFAS